MIKRTQTRRLEKWRQTAVTASAWVLQGDVFPFMVGPDHTGQHLGVVRLGGHIEPGETPWQCAAREVREEASLRIEAIVPPATLSLQEDSLCPVAWDDPTGPQPILTADRSIYYLARADGTAQPGSETRGLLLLTHDDVCELASREMTLGDYLAEAKPAILRNDLPPLPLTLPLKPTGPRLLAKVLQLHPDLGME